LSRYQEDQKNKVAATGGNLDDGGNDNLRLLFPSAAEDAQLHQWVQDQRKQYAIYQKNMEQEGGDETEKRYTSMTQERIDRIKTLPAGDDGFWEWFIGTGVTRRPGRRNNKRQRDDDGDDSDDDEEEDSDEEGDDGEQQQQPAAATAAAAVAQNPYQQQQYHHHHQQVSPLAQLLQQGGAGAGTGGMLRRAMQDID